MGFSSLFKSAINVLMGNEYFPDSSEEVSDGDYSSNYDTSKYEKVLTQFLSRLSEEERDDEETDEFLDNVLEELMIGKVKNTSQGINEAYKNWKLSKGEREQKKNEKISKEQKVANAIIDMLRHYDELSEEERAELIDSDSRFYLGRLDVLGFDYEAVTEIIYSWFENNTFDESKEILISEMPYEYLREYGVKEICKETPLTETEYLFRKFVLQYKDCEDYEEYADYFKRYWLQSGNRPSQIDCDDLIVNRPCYFREKLQYVTPHFHMGKRCIEDDCYQKAQVYLFSDTLEIINDSGRLVIRLSDIIHIDCDYEKYLLEITCNDNHKYLLEYTVIENLLELQALIIYFIKNPQ